MKKPIRYMKRPIASPIRQDITFCMGYFHIPITVTIDNICITCYHNRRTVTELYFQDDLESTLCEALSAL